MGFASKSNADSLCNSAKPSGSSQGYAFASFSSTEEIQDLPTTANLNTNLNIKSSSGKLIAENWSDLLDGSIYMSFQSAGVALDGWWSFSNNDGSLQSSNCSGGTSTSGNGRIGGGHNSDSKWINHSNQSCSNTKYLVCIAKP